MAIADVGRESEIRYLGEIDSSPAAVERIIGKLAGRYSMPIHTRLRLAGIGDDLSITRGGTDGLHDSPLEEAVCCELVSEVKNPGFRVGFG